MNRLTAWPHHRLTLGIAGCLALLTVLGATDGDVDWTFWSGLVIVAVLIALALKEKRRGD